MIAKSNLAFWRSLRRVMESEKCPSDKENQALSYETGIRTWERVLRFADPKTRFEVLNPVSLERAPFSWSDGHHYDLPTPSVGFVPEFPIGRSSIPCTL